jgi:hypothetical protein
MEVGEGMEVESDADQEDGEEEMAAAHAAVESEPELSSIQWLTYRKKFLMSEESGRLNSSKAYKQAEKDQATKLAGQNAGRRSRRGIDHGAFVCD